MAGHYVTWMQLHFASIHLDRASTWGWADRLIHRSNDPWWCVVGGCVLQGTLKAATDLKRFGNDWVEFGWVNHLIVSGQNGAAFDGQGAASWPFNKCPIRKDCKVLPTVSILLLPFVNPSSSPLAECAAN
jgi:hypothetical protein